MKEVVFVHGAKYLSSGWKPTQSLILWFYGLLNVRPDYTHSDEWISSLEKKGYKVIRYKWSGIVSPWHIKKAIQGLRTLLLESENIEKIISSSIGTHIALRASRGISRIKGIVSVCGVYRPIKTNANLVVIYSARDSFAAAANKLFSFAKENTVSKAIAVKDKSHNEFLFDFRIDEGEYKGMALSDVIELFIR